MHDGAETQSADADEPLRAPLGHLSHLGFALNSSGTVDEVVRHLLIDLTSLPGVRRVGVGLSEGGGRRLRFTASDRPPVGPVEWCHIDAYDDVPLTTVVRTGAPIMANLDDLEERFTELVLAQRRDATLALAAVPLPGTGSPIGGLVIFYDAQPAFDDLQWRLLEATARRTAEALRRVRTRWGHESSAAGETPDDADGVDWARLALDGDPRASGQARRFLRRELELRGADADLSHTALLCLSELVTNAIVHAGTTSELKVGVEAGILTVLVRDHGGPGVVDDGQGNRRSWEPVEEPDPMVVHGRGLMLVDALADRWGSERDASGTTVWFALDLGEPEAPAARTG